MASVADEKDGARRDNEEDASGDARAGKTLMGHAAPETEGAASGEIAVPAAPTSSGVGAAPKVRPPRIPGSGSSWTKTHEGAATATPGAVGAPRLAPPPRKPTAPPGGPQRTQPGSGAAVPPARTLMYGAATDQHPSSSMEAADSFAEPISDDEVEALLSDDLEWDGSPRASVPDGDRDTTLRAEGSSDAERTDVTHAGGSSTQIVDGSSTSGSVHPSGPPQRSRTPGAYSAVGGGVERMRGQSPQRQIISEAPPPAAPAGSVAAATTNSGLERPSEAVPPSVSANPIEREIRARADRLKKDDPVGAARAYVELGLLCEWILFDRARAKKHYEAARDCVRTLQSALTRMRRIGPVVPPGPGAVAPPAEKTLKEALEVLADEIAVAETEELRADLLANRARLLEAAGKLDEARAAYGESLHVAPKHAASLHGLEALLRREIHEAHKNLHAELAEHLAREVEAYLPDGTEGDAALAAWLCVERAEILERQLKHVSGARDALKRGVALAPNPGPVRASFVRHLARHDRDQGLAEALRVEAEREADPDRAARLLYASARINLDRLAARGDGISSLARAEQRAPHGSITQSKIFAELVNQLEIDGDHARVVEIRVKRLGLLTRREAIAFEYVRLADSYGRLGRADLAADAASRALTQDPSSRGIRETLDQSLQRLGRHPDRVRAWLLDASSERPERERVRAFVRAADICSRHLNQPEQAIDALRAAWLLDPGNGVVFDSLSALLRAAPRSAEVGQKNAEQRIDLYEQAAQLEGDKERTIGLLEKALSIWEDELDRTDKVMELADRILALDPTRRSGILALQRAARRSGDHDRLARALDAEVKQAQDIALKARLLLEAAEIAERKGDRERALSLIDRALATKSGDVDAGRARVALLRRMARLDEARKTLVALADHDPDAAFETWLEVAELDESFRKAPADAVEAYRAANKLRPEHPLPPLSLVRLLKATKAYKRLIGELRTIAKVETDPRALAQLHTTAAEVEELALGDDGAALKSLEAADNALGGGAAPDNAWDAGLFEGMERILFRMGDDEGLMRLYARWLERKPPASVDHTLRVGLAMALESASPAQAIEVLEALVSVVPNHVPALRRLEHLQRARKAYPNLGGVLIAQANVLGSRRARVGALWEIVSMEEKLGAASTLDALSRITHETPNDMGALDAVIRIASRLVCNVGVPHPALLAARGQLLSAIRTRRELTVDPLARAAYHIEEAALLETADVDPNLRGAMEAYREALTLWPDSFLAARGLERLASHMGDHQALITSQLALAKLTDSNVGKAAHLVKAAELTASHLRDDRTALELYEVALETDPENRDASRKLASMLGADPRRLIERLRPALDRATTQAQATLLGTEIAQAYLRIQHAEGDAARLDYGPGIQAMRLAMRAAPDDLSSLFVLARLYNAQKSWAESRDTLQRVVELTGNDPKSRQTALFSLADLYEGPLADTTLAESTLVNVLSFEPKSKTALERLYALGTKTGDKKLARSSLERLAEYETDLVQRTEYQLRVAEAARESNDGAGMLRALQDGVVSTPQDLRPWTLLARLCLSRGENTEALQSLARAIEQVIDMAKSRRKPLEARWLLTLGLLEVNALKRPTEGLAHLQAALGAASAPGSPPPHPEIRAALGSGLLAAGRNKEAIHVLRELCTTDSETLLRLAEPSAFNTVRSACVAASGTVLSAVLSCLDAAFATEGRTDERLATEEARGALGDLSPDRLNKLRNRRLDPDTPYANALGATELSRMLVSEARSPFIDVAIAIQPIVAKVLRIELSSYGVSMRERIGPRDGHPVRALADRLARCLGISEYDLILSPNWTGPLRAFPGDPPVIFGPASFIDLPETDQAFGLGRLLTRLALGMTWVEEVPVDGADGILLSAVRSVLPNWGIGELGATREHSMGPFFTNMQRAIGRKQRNVIQDLAATLNPTFDARSFFLAVRRSEYRTAYVLSGDLLGGLETMRRSDPELSRAGDNARALLQYPLSNELIRYALSSDGFNERRRLGTVWGAGSSSGG